MRRTIPQAAGSRLKAGYPGARKWPSCHRLCNRLSEYCYSDSAVPPIVISETFTVGIPTVVGTP